MFYSRSFDEKPVFSVACFQHWNESQVLYITIIARYSTFVNKLYKKSIKSCYGVIKCTRVLAQSQY